MLEREYQRIRVKNYDTALQAFHSELSILQESLDILKKNCPSDELQIILDEYGGNYGAVWTNIGLCHFYRDNSGDLELAKKAFNNAFREFTLAYNYALVKDLLFRDEDLSYGFYMSTKRTECGILKYEAMLMYSNALAEAEKLDLAQKIVKELIDSPRISDEGYDTILGCAYGLMSYLLSVAGCEEEAEKRYIESLKLLRDHPDDRKVTVYKRAHSFARNGFLKKSMDTLLSDMPAGTMTKETAEKIVGDWKIKYENK